MKLYHKSELKYSRIFFDKQPPRFLVGFIGFVAILVTGLMVFANYAHKNYIVKGYGSVSDSNIHYVATKSAGVVYQLHKQESEHVNAGDPLFSISSGEEGLQFSALQTQLSNQEQRLVVLDKYRRSLDERVNYLSNSGIEKEYYGKVEYYLLQLKSEQTTQSNNNQDINERYAKQNQLNSELLSIEQRIITLESQLKAIEKELSRQETTMSSTSNTQTPNTSVTKQLENKAKIEAELAEAKGQKTGKLSELEGVKNEIKQLERNGVYTQGRQVYLQLVSELGSAYSQTEKAISELKANMQVNEKRDSNYTVYATSDGIVHYQTPLKLGMTLQQGQVVAEISKHDDSTYYVEAFVPTSDISKVQVGQFADLAIVGVNTQKYGTLKGKVKAIDTGIVTQRTENNSQSFYRVHIALDNKTLVQGTDEIKLVLSMPIEARIVYDKETYFEWLLEQLSFKN